MTAVPAMLEPPVYPNQLPAGEIDDATLLDSAATVWALISYGADLPATPETKTALKRARAVLLREVEALGLCEADLHDYVAGFRSDRICREVSGDPPLPA
jgi:hypothetical protein